MTIERTPTNEQIESTVAVRMDQLKDLPLDVLMEFLRQQLMMTEYLKRQLLESVELARVVVIDYK